MAKKATNPQNLKPFPKGKSGNPAGYKKGVPNASTRLKKLLAVVQRKENAITGKVENISIAEQLDIAQIVQALDGNVVAYRELMDRLEGKAKQSLEVTEKTIKVLHTDPDDA